MPDPVKICCAVDFSKSSKRAMVQAADLARRLGADLMLLHVVEPTAAVATVFAGREVLAERAAADAQSILAEWRAEAEQLSGRPVVSELASGDAASEIIRAARESRVDLLVVASNGRAGLKALVLGSVAERLARQAPCAVLIARRREGGEAELDAEELAQYRTAGS